MSTFEFLSRIQIHLLSLSYLLQNLLDHHAVIYSYITTYERAVEWVVDSKGAKHAPWSNLNMIVTLHNIDIQLPSRRCQEHSLVDFELFTSD